MKDSKTISRRQLLTGGLALGAATLARPSGFSLRLWPESAHAQSPILDSAQAISPRYFLTIHTRGQGGMDCTLGLDPWTQSARPPETDMFIEYRDDEVIRARGLALGPAAAALAPHAADCAVINGILVGENDNGHEAAMMYMSTGNGAGTAPDLVGELAVSSPVGPYGVLTDLSTYMSDRSFAISRIGDISSALDNLDPTATLARLIGSNRRTPLQRAQGDVIASGGITRSLLDLLRGWRTSGQPIDEERVVAAAFLSGASRQAQLQIAPSVNLDTHSGHVGNHLRGQKSVWDRTAAIFALFKSIPHGDTGRSLFDHTTFFVYSEFSRTPALDAAGGKNHNPLTNSALLAGCGVRGGATIGASRLISAAASPTRSSYHMATPFDWATERPTNRRSGASFVFPENVIRTCAEIHGADLEQFRSVETGMKPIRTAMS